MPLLPTAPAAALHLWAPPGFWAALTDRIDPAAGARLVDRGDLPEAWRRGASAGPGPGGPGQGLALPDGAAGLVLYPGLAEDLAPDLPVSGEVGPALARWSGLCEALLAARAAHRGRLMLMAAADLADALDRVRDSGGGKDAEGEGGVLAALAAQTGLRLARALPSAPACPPSVPAETRIAAAALLQLPGPARDLCARLAAASLPRAAGAPPDPSTPAGLRAAVEAAAQAAQAARLRQAEAERQAEMRAEAVARAVRSQEEALADAERAAAALRAEAAALARDLAARDARMRDLAQSLREAQDEAGALRASTSWRITAPLRAASLLLRRLRP